MGSQSSINRPKAEDISSIIRKSQARVSKALVGKPQFFLSNVETQDTLKLFAKNKTNLVILNVDLVASTKLSMTLSLDRLAMIIQAFNQEMSLVIKEFGGYILKYVGDAVLAFFFVPEDQSEKRYSVVNALNCAKCMIQVVLKAMNTVLAKHDYSEISIRIGLDIGENAVIQSGWDSHSRIRNLMKNDTKTIKEKQSIIKKPVFDILSYTVSMAVKMTALANPNHIVIGGLVYDLLDDRQRSLFDHTDVSPEIWSYVCKGIEGNIYKVYTNR